MRCPKCGAENPDDAQTCRSCGAQLPLPLVPPEDVVPRTSKLAIAAFVLGVLSLFTCGLTAIPAIVLGIVAFIIIEKSGGRLTGTDFDILGIIIPVLVCLIIVLLLPALFKMRQTAHRMACATNLSQIGHAICIYTNDYDGQFPRSGGRNSTWSSRIPMWIAPNRFAAYGLAADGSGGQGSVSSCFYLLVKHAEVKSKSFVCKGDSGSRGFRPANEMTDITDETELSDFLWDFGSEPTKHCRYAYHQPFGDFPLTTSSEPGMAVAADKNPWMASPASDGKSAQFGLFNPEGGREAIKTGNAIQHKEDGQNVLFLDSHVGFEKNPFCGVNDDNIYTFWDGGDIRRGGLPVVGSTEPSSRLDSFLVHDGISRRSGLGR